uniref:C-type lectin domain-containing protein n=1 Tax=Oryzias melastigma TaxID=30732 RepID=A0A3B3BVU8_ORYME
MCEFTFYTQYFHNNLECVVIGRALHLQVFLRAKEYCRLHYTDVSSIYFLTQELTDTDVKRNIWTGYNMESNQSSATETGLLSLLSQQEVQGNSPTCVLFDEGQLLLKDCEIKNKFYCFWSNLDLVTENKTWEEALEHCRSQDKELISLPSESALHEVLLASGQLHTSFLWTGARYLAGSWLWMDGTSPTYNCWSQGQEPSCPALSNHCGALSLEEEVLESWDCDDKLNFVCRNV